MSSAVSGAIDVDVAVLSVLRLVDTIISPATAGQAVLAAVATNALLRLILAIASGPARFWIPLLTATGVATGLGSLAFFLLPSL